jgi:hypothetical protein
MPPTSAIHSDDWFSARSADFILKPGGGIRVAEDIDTPREL